MALPLLLDAIERLPAFTRLVGTLPGTAANDAHRGSARDRRGAVLVAALARQLPGRFFVVVTQGLPDAERWLADLQSLASDTAVALYPPREGFGEAEPHAEVAGERVETLERVGARRRAHSADDGARRARADAAPRCRSRGATRAPGGRRDGDREDLAAHLEAVGFERVPMVEEVAQFSVRGGIFDIYGFGMADPARLEFWGDEIAELRHFDLLTQRSTRPAEVALVLPVDGARAPAPRHGASTDRVTLTDLFPPDTIVVIPSGAHLEPELRRTWEEAQHHVELARRRGEDAPPREELYQSPEAMLGTRSRHSPPSSRTPTADGADVAISASVRRIRSIATSPVSRASSATACRR